MAAKITGLAQHIKKCGLDVWKDPNAQYTN